MLIKIFYANFKHECMTFISEVNNTKIVFSLDEFGTLCKLPTFGRTHIIYVAKYMDNNNNEIYIRLFRI